MLALRLEPGSRVRKRRSVGFRSDRGTWVKVECRGLEWPLDQGWGIEAVSAIAGLPMPVWHQGGSWLDVDRGVRWRADETGLLTGIPIGSPQNAQELPSAWWVTLGSALDALAKYRTFRRATPDLAPATEYRCAAAIARVFPTVGARISEWTTARADFNWPNLAGPALEVFDWEDFEEDEAGELATKVLIEPGELPALRAALTQVADDPDFAVGRWDTARSWLAPDNGFAPDVFAAADGPWELSRTRAAVVISGPVWYPVVYPSGALTADFEYARLVDLISALDALGDGPVRLPDLDAY
jgi:hypothetical protein